MKLRMPSVIISTCVLALTALAVQAGRVELQASLHSAGRGKGKASWKVRAEGSRFQAELQVEGENLPRNADLTVDVASMDPITVTTNSFGSFTLNRRFTPATAPMIAVGDPVTVSDVNEVQLLNGAFVKK